MVEGIVPGDIIYNWTVYSPSGKKLFRKSESFFK